jgi:hypothetical protein
MTQLNVWANETTDANLGASVALFAFRFIWLPATLAILFHVGRRIFRPQRLERADKTGWVAAACVSVLMLIASFRFDRCPHATYVIVGPVYHTSGRPCHNPRHFKSILGML